MSRPSVWRGVAAAAGLAIAAALFMSATVSVFGVVIAARAVIPALSFVYLLFLVRSSSVRPGRLTVLALWAATSAAAWFFVSSFALYLSVHLLFMWLVRSFYFHRGVLAPLLDGALCAVGAIAALGALHRTGSPLLSVWVFFLIQAAFAAIPEWASAKPRRLEQSADDAFAAANRRAEAAFNQLLMR